MITNTLMIMMRMIDDDDFDVDDGDGDILNHESKSRCSQEACSEPVTDCNDTEAGSVEVEEEYGKIEGDRQDDDDDYDLR